MFSNRWSVITQIVFKHIRLYFITFVNFFFLNTNFSEQNGMGTLCYEQQYPPWNSITGQSTSSTNIIVKRSNGQTRILCYSWWCGQKYTSLRGFPKKNRGGPRVPIVGVLQLVRGGGGENVGKHGLKDENIFDRTNGQQRYRPTVIKYIPNVRK